MKISYDLEVSNKICHVDCDDFNNYYEMIEFYRKLESRHQTYTTTGNWGPAYNWGDTSTGDCFQYIYVPSKVDMMYAYYQRGY